MIESNVLCFPLLSPAAAAAAAAKAGSLSDEMLALVNKARQQQGVPPLQFSQELEDAAQHKSDEMAGQTSATQRHNLRGRTGVQGGDFNPVPTRVTHWQAASGTA
jgi:uncharacterized protein YkwD